MGFGAASQERGVGVGVSGFKVTWSSTKLYLFGVCNKEGEVVAVALYCAFFFFFFSSFFKVHLSPV